MDTYEDDGEFFQTESESRTHETFTFVLTNAATDSAVVNAARNANLQELTNWTWSRVVARQGRTGAGVREFTALITINRDTTETWALFLGSTSGSDTPSKHVAFLTNGERKILLSLASSNKNAYDFRGSPAFGMSLSRTGNPFVPSSITADHTTLPKLFGCTGVSMQE